MHVIDLFGCFTAHASDIKWAHLTTLHSVLFGMQLVCVVFSPPNMSHTCDWLVGLFDLAICFMHMDNLVCYINMSCLVCDMHVTGLFAAFI